MTARSTTGPAAAILAERVHLCVPLRHPAFGQLLRLLRIEASVSVPSAAVTVGDRSRLLLNPDFMARHCRTDEHLAMLVMHELYHVLLGHTRLVRRPTLSANWAFDCIINAQLCRLHPQVAYTSFFSALAAPDGPWSLIGPPPGWPGRGHRTGTVLCDIHRRLYDDDGVTTTELFALLQRQAGALDPDGRHRLLGQHDGDDAEGDPLWADPDLMAEVRRLVARWPMDRMRGGLDDGGAVMRRHITLRRQAAAQRAVASLLRTAATDGADGPVLPAPVATPTLTPLPHQGDRRAMVQRAAGARPLLWQGLATYHGRAPSGTVAVYLDVSGSMSTWLPVLLKALDDAAAVVRWPLLGFSTEVLPITRADLAQGRFQTTGGTDIDCVGAHLLQQGIRRAVVITDGDVQTVREADAARLRRRRVRVHAGLLDGGPADFCRAPGWRLVRLPPLSAGTA